MVSTFNVDAIPQLRKASELFREAQAKLHKGVESAIEVAEESGAAKLIQSAHNMREGTDALEKTMVECANSIDAVADYLRDLDEGLN